MNYSGEFDEANADRKKRINIQALITAKKLNLRMHNFLQDINSNHNLTNGQKEAIKAKLIYLL